MGMTIEQKRIVCEGFIDDDQVMTLRDFLSSSAPDEVEVDFTNCRDIHSAILQVLVAYKALYPINFIYGDGNKLYQRALEGVVVRDNDSR